MSDTTQTNAMAEIALALAMGFFSIMVLTMVSMGSTVVAQNTPNIDSDPIQISKTSDNKHDQSQATANTSQKVEPEQMVIFFKDQYLDHMLSPVSTASLQEKDKVILAVSPDLSMSKTMSARNQIKHQDITVVVLNKKWLTALKEAGL